MALTKEQLLEELKNLQNTGTQETRRIRAESLLIIFINDPEIDKVYMEILTT
ncbi:MAG: hypothetical protein IIC76_12180 [Bacteroidetes bacterium]|nr:hypothetical protein [Bacteroidota bacterium]